MVIEVVLDTLDDLVVLVALTGNKNDIVFLRQCASGLDSNCTVFDNQGAAQLLCRKTIRHIFQDIFRFFVPRVIANVIIGTFLFQGIVTMTPTVMNNAIHMDMSEVIRVVASQGMILYALTRKTEGTK